MTTWYVFTRFPSVFSSDWMFEVFIDVSFVWIVLITISAWVSIFLNFSTSVELMTGFPSGEVVYVVDVGGVETTGLSSTNLNYFVLSFSKITVRVIWSFFVWTSVIFLFSPIVSTTALIIYLFARLGWTSSRYLMTCFTSRVSGIYSLGIIFFYGDSGNFMSLISCLITSLCYTISTVLVFGSIFVICSKVCFVCSFTKVYL